MIDEGENDSDVALRTRLVQLLELHRPALHAYAFALTGDLHLADDAVQEMACIAARETQRIPADATAAADWLRAVLRRKALELGRQQRRQRRRLAPAVIEAIDRSYEEEEVGAWEQAARQRALRSALASCFELLSSAARQALARRYCDRASCQEIAALLDRRIDQVYSLLRRSRTKLGDCVRRRMETDGGH